MLTQWTKKRIIIAGFLGLLELFIIFLFVRGYIPIRDGEETTSYYLWALTSIYALFLLVALHVIFQWIGRHLEYISFLFNIILFVSVVTLSISLGIATIAEEPIEAWVILVMILSVATLLVLVLVQAISLRIARDTFRNEFERIVLSSEVDNVTLQQKRSLIDVCKRLIPVDYYPGGKLSIFSDYPNLWEEIKDLVTQIGIEWDDEKFELIRGCNTPKIKRAEQAYFYSGLTGYWIGTLVIVIGNMALNN
jgi:hypothetical protein